MRDWYAATVIYTHHWTAQLHCFELRVAYLQTKTWLQISKTYLFLMAQEATISNINILIYVFYPCCGGDLDSCSSWKQINKTDCTTSFGSLILFQTGWTDSIRDARLFSKSLLYRKNRWYIITSRHSIAGESYINSWHLVLVESAVCKQMRKQMQCTVRCQDMTTRSVLKCLNVMAYWLWMRILPQTTLRF